MLQEIRHLDACINVVMVLCVYCAGSLISFDDIHITIISYPLPLVCIFVAIIACKTVSELNHVYTSNVTFAPCTADILLHVVTLK